MKKFFVIFLIILLLLFSSITEQAFPQSSNVQVTKEKTLQYAKPKKPLKIKLHRNAKGEYSWDITGESVDEIVRADKRLRQLLKED